MEKNMIKGYLKLYEACHKYPRTQLTVGGPEMKSDSKIGAKDGFIAKYCSDNIEVSNKKDVDIKYPKLYESCHEYPLHQLTVDGPVMSTKGDSKVGTDDGFIEKFCSDDIESPSKTLIKHKK